MIVEIDEIDKLDNLAEVVAALGDVQLHRIVYGHRVRRRECAK